MKQQMPVSQVIAYDLLPFAQGIAIGAATAGFLMASPMILGLGIAGYIGSAVARAFMANKAFNKEIAQLRRQASAKKTETQDAKQTYESTEQYKDTHFFEQFSNHVNGKKLTNDLFFSEDQIFYFEKEYLEEENDYGPDHDSDFEWFFDRLGLVIQCGSLAALTTNTFSSSPTLTFAITATSAYLAGMALRSHTANSYLNEVEGENYLRYSCHNNVSFKKTGLVHQYIRHLIP